MTLEQLWRKIGKQPLKVTVTIDNKEYVITDIKYQNGKWLCMNAQYNKKRD